MYLMHACRVQGLGFRLYGLDLYVFDVCMSRAKSVWFSF